MKLKLYEIAANVEAALMADEFNEEELTALVESMQDKAVAIVAVSDKIGNFVNYCKDEEKRIATKRKFAENRARLLIDYLHNCMNVSGFAEMEIGTKTAKIVKNPPSVIIEDGELIPAEFKVVEMVTVIRKAEIKKALKSGPVPGASLSHGTSLRIK